MPTTEERLAALEKQMAAWIDQQPTNYYTHQYSGEEIDAAVGRAVAGGTLDTSVTNIGNQLGTFVRPNLLDNWYFGNPVNQRGEISKSGITNGYWIDRWYLSGYDQAVEITQSGLRWTSTTGIWFTQRMDDALVEALIGRTVTISAIVNGELKTRTQKLDKNTMITCLLSDGLQRIELSAESKLLRFVSYSSPTVPLTILAAKLELGPTQTLAHKEGDKWVLNEVPKFGRELAECQRYFWRMHSIAKNNYAIFAYGMKQSADQVRFVIPFPATFRVSPAITVNGKFLVSDGIKDYAVDNIVKQSFNGESIVLVAKSSTISALPEGTLMRFGAFNDTGAYVDFSADL